MKVQGPGKCVHAAAARFVCSGSSVCMCVRLVPSTVLNDTRIDGLRSGECRESGVVLGPAKSIGVLSRRSA